MLALAIDLIWGYAGILSLGHGAFFALGGYAMGMYLMRQIGTRGVYGNPILPDFMVFLNWKELPWFWYGFDHFWLRRADGRCWCPALLAFVFGWFAFRSRVTGVYLSIITQALTYALMLGFFRNDMGFGGNNGLTDFKDILGFNLQAEGTRAALLVRVVHRAGAGFLICRARRHVEIRQGAGRRSATRKPHAVPRLSRRSLQAVRVHPVRVHGRHRRRALCAAGRHHQSERIRAGNSIEAVIWVAVGGRGTLFGAVLGAFLVNYAKTFFTGACSRRTGCSRWAGSSSLVTLFLPRGIVGTCRTWRERRADEDAVGGRLHAEVRTEAGGVSTMEPKHDIRAALSRRRHGQLRRLQGAQRSVASSSSRARCARSSGRTAPARPR